LVATYVTKITHETNSLPSPNNIHLIHTRQKNVKSKFNNHSRIFHSPVSAQGRLIAQIEIISRMSTCALWEEQRLSRQDKEPKLRLSLETRVTEDVTVISCKGRIAYGIEAAALSGEFAELAPQTRRVVIDLSGVELIDAAGLGALISVALTAQASQWSIKMAASGNLILALLYITMLN